MKFKSDIEVQAGLRDGSDDIGTAGQLLSSTGTITNWIDQADVISAGATRVLIACKNTSGGTITKGTPVYQTGNVGATDVIEIAEADALISTGYLPAIGLLETDLINNAFGNVVITGELLNITTSPIDGVVPVTGDTIYLKSGGGLTLTKPTGEGNAIQNLGLVGKVSGGNAGSLTVASIMRQNDVPNLPEGRIWIGDGNTIVSDTVYVDEPNGRVGIGTTSPLGAIQIGDLAAASPSTNQILVLSNIATTGGNSNLYLATGASGTSTIGMGSTQFSPTNTAGKIIYSDTVDTFSFDTNFSTKMVINGSGSVGIGTTNPQEKLHVSGSSNVRLEVEATDSTVAALKLTNTARSYASFVNASGSLNTYDYNAASVRTTLLTSGNFGIGTTTPGSKLEVGGEIDASGGDGYRINGKPWAAESSNNLRLGDWDGEGFSTSIFDDNSSEVMRVTGGNVGIGTTTPSEKLAVVGTTGVIIDSGSSSGALLTLKGDGSSYGGGAQINIIGGSQDYLYYATNIIRSPGTPEAIEKYEMYDHKWTWDGNMGSTTAQPYTSYAFKSQGSSQMVIYNNNVGIGTTSPQAKLQVNGGVQLANDTAVAWAGKVGTFRYRTSGNNSYVDMCMQTGASTYAWVNIVTNSW